MFLLRMVKHLIVFVLTLWGLWWMANYSYQGKPLYQYAFTFFGSEKYREGIKDLRMLTGGFLKTVGQQIEEDVSDKDRKALDQLIQDQTKHQKGNPHGSK